MKKTNKSLLILFSICFILAWSSVIFYFDKNDFDIEFREKGITTGTVVDLFLQEIDQETDDGRASTYTSENYIDYTYFVDGAIYKNFSNWSIDEYVLGDQIEIEYAKSNPQSSRIKDHVMFKFNFFIRNFVMVTFFSFLAMVAVIYAWDILNKRDPGWR